MGDAHRRSPSTKWSAYAGVYAFLCAAVVLSPLGFLTGTLLEVLPLPGGSPTVLLAAPGAVIGGVVWWALVERGARYTYPTAGAVGLLTALLTVLLWVSLFAIVWSPSLVRTAGLVVAFVLAVTVPAGVVAGLPLMYARRRLGDLPAERGR